MRYVPPEEFEELRVEGMNMGFRAVFSAPLVRSSFHAAEIFKEVHNPQISQISQISQRPEKKHES